MVERAVIHSDGGSRGNPGPAGVGFTLKSPSGNLLFRMGKFIGQATNNDAEYTALIMALEKAQELGIKEAACFLDSELVVRQLNGEYRVKNPGIKKRFDGLQRLLPAFRKISFVHVTRDKNAEADKLVNEALDKQEKQLHVKG